MKEMNLVTTINCMQIDVFKNKTAKVHFPAGLMHSVECEVGRDLGEFFIEFNCNGLCIRTNKSINGKLTLDLDDEFFTIRDGKTCVVPNEVIHAFFDYRRSPSYSLVNQATPLSEMVLKGFTPRSCEDVWIHFETENNLCVSRDVEWIAKRWVILRSLNQEQMGNSGSVF